MPRQRENRTVQAAVDELKELKSLRDANVIDLVELQRLKGILMAELQ